MNAAGVLAILTLIFAAGGFYHLGVMVRWECMKAAAMLMCAVAFVTIPIPDAQYELWRMFDGAWNSQNVFMMLVPVAVFAVPALLNAAMCGKGRSWMLIALPAIFLAIGFALTTDAASIAAYAIALGWSAWLFLRGVRGDNLKMMNIGTIGALYLILVKFIASDASFTAKGIILIASGAALTAANIWLIRRRRAKGGAK